ncbi:enoyl-CoA hydratase-related protein [Dactylosporangium maewongense]|uniref:Enoyl-CoA hydratase-related protein n=1 Tax=Dactylosporangium maewongense TaxID=634393 RepID=A0ABN1ZPH2_9ACTN
MTELLEVFTKDRVGYLRFNRPDKLNALAPEMLEGFTAGLTAHEADPDVRVVVVCSTGRAFSTGGDMSGPGRAASAGHRSSYTDWQRQRASLERWLRIWDSPKPVVAAVQGYCLGTATVMAVMCDLTVVADDAVIGWPQLPVGGGLLSPVASWFVGPKKARELAYIAGSRFSAQEAVELGWANHVYPAGELHERAHELATRIANTPSDVLAVKKYALNRTMNLQGFRDAVLSGAEFSAVSHQAPGAEFIAARRAELGMKETIAAVQQGLLAGDYPQAE